MGETLVKKSFTLRERLVKEAEQFTGPRGMSAYLDRALENQLRMDRLTDYLKTTEAELGAISPAIQSQARTDMAAALAAMGQP